MSNIDNPDLPTSVRPVRQRLYTAMWRWHFYAGLLSIPICIFLGTTGAIYLFKPFVEPLLYHDLQTVTVGDSTLSLTQQLEAAQSARPDVHRNRYWRTGPPPHVHAAGP
jgi:uncharacterized iron-regulated membrane protein